MDSEWSGKKVEERKPNAANLRQAGCPRVKDAARPFDVGKAIAIKIAETPRIEEIKVTHGDKDDQRPDPYPDRARDGRDTSGQTRIARLKLRHRNAS